MSPAPRQIAVEQLTMSSDAPRQVAVEQLKSFGLSTYAAKTLVALIRIKSGTAKEISGISGVPRTRVYDAVDELEASGLVDIQQSEPKRFWAVSRETAGRHFERQFDRQLNRFRTAVGELDTETRPEEQRGVWTVTGRETVTDRVIGFIEGADEEVVFMSVEELITDDIVSALGAARERGVPVKLGEMSETAHGEIETVVSGTEFVPSLWNWEEAPSGRLVMVDNRKTLVSVLVPGEQRLDDETAIWGAGTNNSLVVVLRALFTWQLDGSTFE